MAEIGQWNFSLGLGYGHRTNPLHFGKDTPLYVLPSLSYYGENIYFDDGVFGYSVEVTPQLYVSAITQLNGHSANFSRWHPSNFLITNATKTLSSEQFNETDEPHINNPINMSHIAKRRWAVDAGFQVNYFTQHNLMMQLSILGDISGVYKGLNGQLKLEKAWRIAPAHPLSIKLSGSLQWFSQELASYYYGLSERDSNYQGQYYRPDGGFNTTFGLSANYQLYSNWRIAMSYKVTTLDPAIRHSPLTKTRQSCTYFIGAIYDF